MTNHSDSSDDEIVTFFVVIVLAGTVGPALAAHFFGGAQALLVSWGVLVRHHILVPIGGGAGLDFPRALIGFGAALGLLTAIVFLIRHQLRKRSAKRS